MSDASSFEANEFDIEETVALFGERMPGKSRAATDPDSASRHMHPQDEDKHVLPAQPASQPYPRPPQLEVVINQFLEVENDPARFREGIETYRPFVDDTHLPQTFRHFHDPCKDLTPSTFLILLTNCLPIWFDKSKPKKSEKSDQRSKKSFSKAEADLEWLLQLIHDYIRFTLVPLTEEDVNAIVERVSNFCQAATNEKEVDYGINILFEVSKRFNTSSPQNLHEILVVLTAAAKAISPIPKTVEAYLRFLLTSDISDLCLQSLEALISVPNRENGLEGLLYARGACRLLGIAFEYRSHANTYIVQLHRLISLLHDAAAREIFRFSRDILHTCESIIGSEERREELLDNGFSNVITILSLCLRLHPADGKDIGPNPWHQQPSLSMASAICESTRIPIEEQLSKRLTQALSVGRQLGGIWAQLNENQKIEVTDYVLQYPRFNPESLVFDCLAYTFDEKLCWPGKSEWSARLHSLGTQFINDPSASSKCRTAVIERLGDSISSLWNDQDVLSTVHNNPLGEAYTEATRRVLTMLRDQCITETDSNVFEALVVGLPLILGVVGRHIDNDTLIQETVVTFERQVLENSTTRQSAIRITNALVNTFRVLFHSRPDQVLHVFESLLNIAGIDCKVVEARIEAMRLLFRIRCTSTGNVYITDNVDSEYVATMLCRTRSSWIVSDQEIKTQRHSAGSATGFPARKDPSGPSWLYDDEAHGAFESLSPSKFITTDRRDSPESGSGVRLDIGAWLAQATTCLQTDPEWDSYSYVLVHLSSQLTNIRLFRKSLPTVAKLRQVVHEQIMNASFKAPPAASGLFKHDVALCLFNFLTPLIAYAALNDPEIDKSHWERQLVQAFMAGMDDAKYDGTFRGCVHALSVCSLEIPERVGREYPRMLENMRRVTTKSHLSIHMLEFLSQVAILPEVHKHFNLEDKRTIFGLCFAVLNDRRDEQLKQQELREQGTTLLAPSGPRAEAPRSAKTSRSPYRLQMLQDVGVPLYVSALAYHTMICWFLSLPMRDREALAKEILKSLIWYNKQNEPIVDQQAEVFRDMLLRTTYSDLGETTSDPVFAAASAIKGGDDANIAALHSVEDTDGKIESASWIVGFSIITVETAGHSGRTQITKRQASGTTYATYQQSTSPMPPHQAPSNTAIQVGNLSIEMLPQHVMLQLQATAAPMDPDEQPIPLPNDEAVSRALRVFDMNATIDSHKAGVLFVGPDQSEQAEIMSNVMGSADYETFVSGLGYEVSLQPPCRLINPQGLRYPTDGDKTIAWCDRVTEIVFLVPTMMPLDAEDEQEWLRRWANVGNSYVNIVFNRSGRAWKLENLQSQFNYVNIVITPVDWNDGPTDVPMESPEIFYQVQVVTKEGFPNISPAADPKVLSAAQLPKFVRVLAISACVFSQAWEKKDEDREFHSPWRNRLIAIKKLRRRYGTVQRESHNRIAALPSHTVAASATSGRRTPVPREEATTGHGHEADDPFFARLNFTRWMSYADSSDRSK